LSAGARILSIKWSENRQAGHRILRDAKADSGQWIAAGLKVGLRESEIAALLARVPAGKDFEHLHRARLSSDALTVVMRLEGRLPVEVQRVVRMTIRRRGVERRLVLQGAQIEAEPRDEVLMAAIGKGMRWWARLVEKSATTIRDIALSEGVSDRYVSRLLPLFSNRAGRTGFDSEGQAANRVNRRVPLQNLVAGVMGSADQNVFLPRPRLGRLGLVWTVIRTDTRGTRYQREAVKE
jgi:hypothetical protein